MAFGPLNQGLNRDEAYQIALQQLERLNIVGLKDRSVNTYLVVNRILLHWLAC